MDIKLSQESLPASDASSPRSPQHKRANPLKELHAKSQCCLASLGFIQLCGLKMRSSFISWRVRDVRISPPGKLSDVRILYTHVPSISDSCSAKPSSSVPVTLMADNF